MCQAAAEGVVDFSHADPADPHWWIRLNILLDQLATRNRNQVHQLNHATTASLLTRTDLTEQSLDRLRDQAEQLVTNVKQSLFPWIEFSTQRITQQAIEQMHAQWEAIWGKYDSLETQAKIEATVAKMKADNVRNRRAA